MKVRITSSKKKLWILTISSYSFFLYLIYVQTQGIEYPEYIGAIGIGVILSTIILMIADVLENNVYNKWFWVISMLCTPPLSVIAYIAQRDKLIKLGQRFNLNSNSSTKK
jgi:glucose uptake protein GlcU